MLNFNGGHENHKAIAFQLTSYYWQKNLVLVSCYSVYRALLNANVLGYTRILRLGVDLVLM